MVRGGCWQPIRITCGTGCCPFPYFYFVYGESHETLVLPLLLPPDWRGQAALFNRSCSFRGLRSNIEYGHLFDCPSFLFGLFSETQNIYQKSLVNTNTKKYDHLVFGYLWDRLHYHILTTHPTLFGICDLLFDCTPVR